MSSGLRSESCATGVTNGCGKPRNGLDEGRTSDYSLLQMSSKFTWGLGALVCVVAVVLAVPAFAARQYSSEPGNAADGKKVYIQFCGKCHALKAAGAQGTLGPNLDLDKVSYTRVVTSIEEGVGGIQAEYVLRNVSFNQVYDVAKYVVTYRASGGTSGEVGG
jgi:mono/diheme cytochrome c family protein